MWKRFFVRYPSAVAWLIWMLGCQAAEPLAPQPAAAVARQTPILETAQETALPDSFIGVTIAARSAEVAASTAGYLERVLVHPGDAVARGQVLAQVDAGLVHQRLLRAEAALAGADTALQRATTAAGQAAERYTRRAAAPELFSREELTAAAHGAKTAAADQQAAAAGVAEQRAAVEGLRREVAATRVRAPFAGLVALRLLDPGARVVAGTAIIRLVSAEERRVRFAVPLETAATLAIGCCLLVGVGDQTLPARVVHVAPGVDAAADMVFVEAAFDGPSAHLRTGVGVRVRLAAKG